MPVLHSDSTFFHVYDLSALEQYRFFSFNQKQKYSAWRIHCKGNTQQQYANKIFYASRWLFTCLYCYN